MTYGFVVTTTDKDAVASLSAVGSAPSDAKFYDGVCCWTSKEDTKQYVELYSDDNYFLVTIGKAYQQADLAEKLALHINRGGCPGEFVAANIGQYCVVIYDRSKNKYSLISDALGVRSLFYTVVNDQLFIASSIGMLKGVLGKAITLRNVEGESFLLRYAFLPPGQTVYKDVLEFPPGQMATISSNTLQLEKATPLNVSVEENSNHCDYVGDLAALLMKACNQQAGDAKKVAVLLGGFDSALVASMLVRLGYNIETFSFRYADEEYNQPHVETLADYLSITHHWVDIDHQVIKNGLARYSECCNTPTIWPNYVIQTQHICGLLAERGFDACFSGDGCDTAFMGYPSTYRRGGVYQQIPKFSFGFSEGLISLLDLSRLELVMGHIYRVVLSLLRASSYPKIERPLRSFQLFDPKSYQRLTGEDVLYDAETIFSFLEKKAEGFSFDRKMYFGKSLFSPNQAKLVGSSDVSGFVIDSPYMHPSVKAFAQSLPDEVLRPQKGGAKEGKELLMKMAEQERFLPNEIIFQKKLAAIKSPIDEWYSNELAGFSKGQCSALPFQVNSPYLDSLIKDLFVERIYKNYFSDDRVVSLGISMLVTYASFF